MEKLVILKFNNQKMSLSKKRRKNMTRVFVFDEFGPEDTAMLQALYSRSPQSVTEHIKKVKQTGSGKFMEQFYIGYGHKSIADCGSTTLFIEGLSMLADKEIQDWSLYSGQETSTRFINMSKQPIVDPVGTRASKDILERWMDFYTGSQESMGQHLRKKYPRKPGEDEKVYDKAIKARAFDSLRGFLPAGITTQLSWHTNLRQAWDKLCWLKHHPLAEVKEVAQQMLMKLAEKYSHSFNHRRYDEKEAYWKYVMENRHYFQPKKTVEFAGQTNINIKELRNYRDIIVKRPDKTELPPFMEKLGNVMFNFWLDFGSFRDIQRHRHGVCEMPLLTTKLGFNEWYLEQLPPDLRKNASVIIREQKKAIRALKASPEILQYYIAMGFNVACSVSYGLPATVYVVELRCGKTVHPTLRKVAHKMYYLLREMFPGLKLHCDLAADDWDIRRGLQDISIKK